MGDSMKNIYMPTKRGIEQYRKDIVDIVDKIEDERFLKRIYISLSEYAKEKGLD